MRQLRFILLVVLFMNIMNMASAQEKPVTLVSVLEDKVEGKGTIVVNRDLRLDSLIGNYFNPSLSSQITVRGYRVQVYQGSNDRSSRTRAQYYEQVLKQRYGKEMPVYCYFKSPSWLCIIGDFLYYEDAYAAMRRIKKELGLRTLFILPNQEIKVNLDQAE